MKTIHTGLIGFGRIGRVHALVGEALPLVAEFPFAVDTRLVYTAESSLPSYAAARHASTPQAIIQDGDIHIVDICTPNDSHYPLGKEAIAAGKAVYIEKPPALNAAQAAELARLAREKSVLSQTGLNYRFLPGVNALREEISKGTLGRITGFTVRALHSGYLNPSRPIGWNLKQETSGGGPLLDLGIHLMDTVRYILGEVKGVQAQMGTEIKERPGSAGASEPVDVEDWGRAVLWLENGASGTVEVTRVASLLEEVTTFEISGTKGSFFYDIHDPWILQHHSWETGVTRRYRCKPESGFGRHAAALYPSGALSMGWLIDSQFACLANFYGDVAEGRKSYAETPDLSVAARAQKLVQDCYDSAGRGGAYTPCKGEQ
ncbi:Gfo/Idh/MocA family protein [Caproiciproducens sp.]